LREYLCSGGCGHDPGDRIVMERPPDPFDHILGQ
jgi:hypothetical protein